MNFLMTLGLVTVFVGYAKAGVALSVKGPYETPSKDDLDEDYYGESITVRKPIQSALDLTSAKPVDKTESSKQSALENTGEDGKSNVHHHDEETNGSYTHVSIETDKRDGGEYAAKPSPHFGAVSSKFFASSGNNRKDGKEEHDFMDTY